MEGAIIITELRIRVRGIIKDRLEQIKKDTGQSINAIVINALYRQLIIDKVIKYWELDNIVKPDPHYETINKMPDEAIELNKFCDGDSCEVDYSKKRHGSVGGHIL